MKRDWSWADWFVSGVRLFWFVLLFTNIIASDHEMSVQLGLAISLSILVYVLPQLFYIPGHIRPQLFIVTEVTLSGAFTVYLMTVSGAINYFYVPMFVVSFMATGRMMGILLPIGYGLLPLLLWFSGGFVSINYISFLILIDSR